MMNLKTLSESIPWKVNDPQIKRNFTKALTWCEGHWSESDQPLAQYYKEFSNIYYQRTSLYIIQEWWIKQESKSNKVFKITNLIIYDTKTKREVEITVDTPVALERHTCITQLPNGELFCYGKKFPVSGIALIIDRSYRVRILPSGIPSYSSSSIYFENNIYCFGGQESNHFPWELSRKFNLNENRWMSLTPIPEACSHCTSVIFNRNILISGFNINIFLYSIDTDSFSTIPYEFNDHSRKILTKAENLYLIECDGLIYESQDEYSWIQISKSKLIESSDQVYCAYNKGAIYIACGSNPRYYKFDLTKKTLCLLK